jgi:hypothetical protein
MFRLRRVWVEGRWSSDSRMWLLLVSLKVAVRWML